jgi:hypothetical protein
MKTGMERRLQRLEHQYQTESLPQLVTLWQGDTLPPGIRERDLILWLHRPWCAQPEHDGRCEGRRQG